LSDDKQDVEQLWREIEVLEGWLPDLKPVRPVVQSMEAWVRRRTNGRKSADDEFHAGSLNALEGFYVKWAAKESTPHQFRMPYCKARKVLMILLSTKRTGVRPPISMAMRNISSAMRSIPLRAGQQSTHPVLA
jgi:hypothetical protein